MDRVFLTETPLAWCVVLDDSVSVQWMMLEVKDTF